VCVSGTTIGDDDTGRLFFDILRQHPGIDLTYVRQAAGRPSMYCCILVNPDGERAIIGVNVDASPPVPPTAEMVQDARLVTLDLYGGSERVETARYARDASRPVVVGDLRDVAHPVLPFTTTVIASAAELRVSYPDTALSDFAGAVQRQGVRDVIITDGGRGVYVFSSGGANYRLRPPSVDVVDATGAGDAFRAGVTYGMLNDWSPEECAALGTAAGSLNVQRMGASNDPPDLVETQQLAEQVQRSVTRL
jgi:sugar/nucleoside kinase (ribokinase family)